MALKFFRQKKNSLKWVFWLLIVVLGAGMLLLFVDTPGRFTARTGGSEVASVNDCKVSVEEFRRSYGQLVQAYRQQLGDKADQFLKQLRVGDQALNQLISQCATTEEAGRLGITATPGEVSERIRELPVFKEPETGRFIGVDRYKQILTANNLTPSEFEEGMRRDILREKLQNLVIDGIEAGPAEVRQEFVNQNLEAKVQYVFFDPEQVVKTAAVDEAELTKYFQENSEQYKLGETRKVKFLQVPIESSKVELSEEVLAGRVAEIPEVERVRASHILIKTAPGVDEDPEVRAKAKAVLDKIRVGADFGEMAREYSEDSSSANGGDLGFFTRGQMVPEFDQVAFTMPVGQVSDIVKSDFGYHIIKVTAAPKTSEESRRMLAEFQLREEKAGELASLRAGELLTELRAGAGIDELAKREGIRAGETAYFGLSDPITYPQVRSDFNQQVFALEQGQFTEPYLATVSYIVAQLEEIRPARLPELADVHDKLVEDYKTARGEQLATERAQAFFKVAKSAGSLEKAAQQEGLSVTTTDFFKKSATVDDVLKFSPIFHERAFKMDKGDLSPPITIAGKKVVFEVIDRTPFDESKFDETKKEIASTLREKKQSAFFTSYLQNVIDHLRKDEKIIVNRELLDDLTG